MSMMTGPDSQDLAAELVRLEQALERIDYLASGKISGVVATDIVAKPISPIILDRLDSMIARLRAAIDEA